jgi:hypothetical protein
MADVITRSRWFFANLVKVILSPEEGGGLMSIVEFAGPPGDMPPLSTFTPQ